MEELKEKFDKLNAELVSQNFTEKEEKEKLDSMRKILKQKCKDQNFDAEGDIGLMDLEKLRELNGTLNGIQVQKKSDKINNDERNAQTSRNKFNPETPYGQIK